MMTYTFEKTKAVRRMFAAVVPEEVQSLGEESVKAYLANLKEKGLIWLAEESFGEGEDSAWETIEDLGPMYRDSRAEWESVKIKQIAYANDFLAARERPPLLFLAASLFCQYHRLQGYWPEARLIRQFLDQNPLLCANTIEGDYCTAYIKDSGAYSLIVFDEHGGEGRDMIQFDTLDIMFDVRAQSESINGRGAGTGPEYLSHGPGEASLLDARIERYIEDELARRLGVGVGLSRSDAPIIESGQLRCIALIKRVVRASLGHLDVLREPADFLGVNRHPEFTDYTIGHVAYFIDDPVNHVVTSYRESSSWMATGDGNDEIPW